LMRSLLAVLEGKQKKAVRLMEEAIDYVNSYCID